MQLATFCDINRPTIGICVQQTSFTICKLKSLNGQSFRSKKGSRPRNWLLRAKPCSGRYADLAVWASRASADEAMAAAQQSPACAAYFGLLQVDSHPKLGYALWRSTRALPVGDFGGMEFSLFRLREGAEESALIPAVRRMVDGLYQNEPGYLGHYVVGDGAGLYADVMLTQTVAQARALCGKWGTGPFAQPCLPYLEKIDPESIDLKFWSRIV